jgi:hypothetical protein
MPITEKDNFEEPCLCLGVINGSVKSFTKVYEERETNIQIIIVCIGVFAFTIVKDFLWALFHTLKR